MTPEERHEYYGFDRFMQVVNTKYENDFYELEKKYYNNEITLEEYNKLFNDIIEKIINDSKKESSE